MYGRIRISLSLAGAALALITSSASATDYCVAPNTTCGGTNVATFQQALDFAVNAPNPDRVFLGAATYTAPTTEGFVYNPSISRPVDVFGAGQGKTVITAPSPGATRALLLYATPASVISDLSVRLPANAAEGALALQLRGTARRLTVTSAAPQSENGVKGIYLPAGNIQDSTITISGPQAAGVQATETGGGSVVRTAITAPTALIAQTDKTFERLRLTASSVGLETGGQGNPVIFLRSSLVRLTGSSSATGVSAISQPTGGVNLGVQGVTIVGNGAEDSTGVAAADLNFPSPTFVNVESSIIRGVDRTFSRNGENSAGGASITASYSAFEPAAGSVSTGTGSLFPPSGQLNPGSNLAEDPRYVNPAAGDFHLRADSALIDSGRPVTAVGLDLDGNSWLFDGNGDGQPVRDMGAFEWRPAPPKPPAPVKPAARDVRAAVITRFRADPSRFRAARKRRRASARVGTRFRYRLDEAATVTITIQRCTKLSKRKRCRRYRTAGKFKAPGRKGANSKRFSGRLKGRALRLGRYRALIKAVDRAKNRSKTRTAAFRIVRR